MKIKMIASDIDSTILPKGGEISKATRDAIAACREAGITFSLSSGRWFPSVAQIAKDIGAEGPVIVANGGCVATTDGVVLKEFGLDPADIEKLYPVIRDSGAMYTSYVNGKILRMHAKQVADVLPQHYYDFCGRVYEVVDEDPVRFEKEGLVCPYKFEVFTNDLVLLEELRAQLTEMGLAISSAFTNNLEIMSKGMGKGPAIRWLANYLGAEFDECMAFGDNTNDLDMLTNVGWPIAVDNAVPAIKAVAREITDACADDGVANYIFKNVLGAK